MTSIPRIPVFSTRFVSAWGKRGDTAVTADIELAALADLRTALLTQYPTDAHGAGYSVHGEDSCPRLAKDVVRVADMTGKVHMHALFVDLDRHLHEPWPDAATAQGTFEVLRGLFPNAAVFTTRKGARLVFMLPRPLSPEAFVPQALGIVKHVKSVVTTASTEVEVDETTAEWTRVFRMPQVVRDGAKTWEDDTFYMHVPEVWTPLAVGSLNPSDARSEPTKAYVPVAVPGDMPERPNVTDDDWAGLIASLAEPLARSGWNGLIGKLRRGEPFYERGKRNATTFKALGAFLDAYAAHAGGVPSAEAIYGVFYASTAASTGTDAQTALGELWGMVCRVVEAQSYVHDVGHRPLPQKTTTTPFGAVPVLVYTGGRSRYVWTPERLSYSEPIGNDDSLRASFVDVWGGVFGVAPIPAVGLLHAYGTYVDEVILDMSADTPRIETTQRSKSLVLPVGKKIDVPAVYSEDVDLWLRAIGGEDYTGLCDWLHWVLKSADPLCALYLSGQPNAGKSMIAQAVAAFYGGVYVDFDEAVTRFNGRLRNSPLIWLDEDSKEAASGKVRSYVGNGLHKIERKGVDAETLKGYLRMFVSANNDDALRMDDVRTVQDVLAITQRVRYIHVGEEAMNLLLRKGGRAWTEHWVTGEDGRPGTLCQHIAWLDANHKPNHPGNRFRLEGAPTSWHLRALYNGAVGAVLAVIAENVAQARNGAGALAYYDGKDVLIDTVRFLGDANARVNLKNEDVDSATARTVLRSLCTESRGDWSIVPKDVLRGMPRSTYRTGKAYTQIQTMLAAEDR